MINEVRVMFRRILIFDIILAGVLAIVSCLFFINYTAALLIGLGVAVATFLINSIITQYAYAGDKQNPVMITIAGFVIRVVIVCGVGLLVYRSNTANIVAYMLGYSSHFISLTLYGITLKKEGM
jgi:ATP synthase protein I